MSVAASRPSSLPAVIECRSSRPRKALCGRSDGREIELKFAKSRVINSTSSQQNVERGSLAVHSAVQNKIWRAASQ